MYDSYAFRLLTILVIACLMMAPALSVSFFVRPDVMQTLSAGCSSHPKSFGVALIARGMLWSRVIRTPFANVFWYESALRVLLKLDSSLKISPHPQLLAKEALDRSYVASLLQQLPASAPVA